AETPYVDVIVADAPAINVPSEQANGVLHAPLFETNVRPAGVGSETVTPVASEGPELVMVIVYETVWPAVIVAGPVFVMFRSAMTVDKLVVSDALLFAEFESVVVVLTEAVFVTEPLAPEAMLYVALTVTAEPAVNIPSAQGN